MGTHHPIRKTVAPSAPEIPDKLYFRIGDVAALCEVPAYVLRFWETEFPQLKPNKGGTGQRLYRRKDVEAALRIKSLLYDQGYTIAGARQVFKSEAKPGETTAASAPEPTSISAGPELRTRPTETPQAQTASSAKLTALREDLRSLLETLSAPISTAPAEAPKPLRPRLVLEPSKPRPIPVTPKSEKPRLQLQQRDLFAFPTADDDPDPKIPA